MKRVLIPLALLVGVCCSRATAEPQGASPSGPIVAIGDAIYGTAKYGGPNCEVRPTYQQTKGCGVVYRFGADGRYTVIHAFSGTDGDDPSSGIAAGPDGSLFGTTDVGGAFGHGVIYRVATDGSGFAVLYAFPNGLRHGTPTIAPDGTVYGIAPPVHGQGHGASIYALSPAGHYRTLYSFGPESHVASPLAIDRAGHLFGVLARAGQCGAEVFWITGTGAYGQLFSNAEPYTSPDCAKRTAPTSGLVDDAGSLYATGGPSLYRVSEDGFKTIFALPPPRVRVGGPFADVWGTFSAGSLTVASDGSLTAAAMASGSRSGCGTVVHFDPVNAAARLTPLLSGGCFGPAVDPSSPSIGFAWLGNTGYVDTDSGIVCRPKNPPYGDCGGLLRFQDDAVTVAFAFDVMDPPRPEWGQYPHGAWFNFLGAGKANTLLLGFSAAPVKQAPYFVRTATSGMSLHPYAHPSTTIPVPFQEEVTKIDTPDASDARTASGTVVLDGPALASGMYSVDWSKFAPVVTDADAYPLALNPLYPSSLYIPPAPAQTPAMRSGQRFVEFEPANGASPRSRPTSLRILTLNSVQPSAGGDTLVLTADDGERVRIESSSTDVTAVPGLTPIVDDPNVRALDARYVGHDVYTIGDFGPTCLFSNGEETIPQLDQATPLHVDAIVRLYGVNGSWGIGPMILRDLDAGPIVVYADPLLVAYGGSRDHGVLTDAPFAGHDCVSAYSEIADTWDFERSLSLHSVLLTHPEWSGIFRDAIVHHQIHDGMTKEQVAASVGYPSVFGSVADVMKLNRWDYTLPAPSSYSVNFRDGHVVDYQPPRMLP